MSKERHFEDINPIQNIKVGYFEKEEYLRIIDRQEKQIKSFSDQIIVLQAKIDILEKNERPQGEWIIKPKENSQSAILICSKCNHFIPITIDKNFCPNCGAEMKIKNISPDSGIREFDKKFADLIVFNDQPQRQSKSSDVHEDV